MKHAWLKLTPVDENTGELKKNSGTCLVLITDLHFVRVEPHKYGSEIVQIINSTHKPPSVHEIFSNSRTFNRAYAYDNSIFVQEDPKFVQALLTEKSAEALRADKFGLNNVKAPNIFSFPR